MVKDNVTLVLTGEVTLADFAVAVRGLLGVVEGLGAEVAPGREIDWIIDGLEVGSAAMTARGVAPAETSPTVVEDVVRAYERLGQCMEAGEPMPFATAVQSSIRQLTRLVNGRIRSIRFETDEADFEVLGPAIRTAGGLRCAPPRRVGAVCEGAYRVSAVAGVSVSRYTTPWPMKPCPATFSRAMRK